MESLNETLYDSSKPNQQVHCTSSKFEIVRNKYISDVQLVTGSEQIEIEIVTLKKLSKKEREKAQDKKHEKEYINTNIPK